MESGAYQKLFPMLEAVQNENFKLLDKLNQNPEVKFALTVKCFGYSNGIISVWIYAAALVRR